MTLILLALALLQPPATVVLDGPTTPAAVADTLPATPVTDAERTAIHIDALVMDLHLTPADALEEMHATITIRNMSDHAITRIPLQISSTLRWQSMTVPFTQSPIATDTDHTGYAQEAILTPAQPLAAHATLIVTAFYAGKIEQSAARLTVLGASPEAAAQTDWDGIRPTTDAASTALRGFGNVLWYPVAASTAILGDTDKLFSTVAAERVANETTLLRLRVTVVYAGDPPNGVILDGSLQPLTALPDEQTTLIGETAGIATADFPAALIGFRTPSLFLTAQPPATAQSQFLSVVAPDPDAAAPYLAAVDLASPLLVETLGPAPRTPLLLLDHAGQPYEDHAFLAAQLAPGADPKAIAPALIRPLTHAWFAAPFAPTNWLDQGLPEMMSLLLLERTEGREAVLAELNHGALLIALSEPDFGTTPDATGQPLTAAASDVYLHRKAAAVLWQLRDILGEGPFREGLLAFRRALSLTPALAQDGEAFEHILEHTSGKDLGWFFPAWVYKDRGLPDLTIVQVNPRALPETRPGRSGGYLISVEVRNDGDAPAEVPVTVRASSGENADTLSATVRLRILAHSSTSTRVLFETTPGTVQVNDGTVPELRTSIHTYKIQQVVAKP